MNKVLFILIALFVAFVPSQLTQAHNSLVATQPAKGAKVDNDIKSVSLIFNANIEKIRSFEVHSSKGDVIKSTKKEINESAMTIYFSDPLKSGKYQVIYDVIGADGHPVHGKYSFTIVKKDKKETNKADNANQPKNDKETKDQNQKQNTTNDEKKEDNPQTKSDQSQGSMNQNMPIFIVLLIGLAAVIILGLYLAFRKNKE